ncbi:MAG: PilZ domain-containing protein [Herbiconiux sp.]|nr:PilZ domain-containing protein [Herbiconiux sp.]
MASSYLTSYETETVAYPVPLRLDRRDAPRSYGLINTGDETLRGLSFNLLGSGLMRATPPLLLVPGQEVRLRIKGDDLPLSTVLIVRWFRPNGDEYLWRVSF